jgi:ABC-type amino acid transport substrate-binding protein
MLVPKASAIVSWDDLSNSTRVLYVRGSEHVLRHIRDRIPDARYRAFDSYGEGFAALEAGQGDLLAGSAPRLFDLAAQSGGGFRVTAKYVERPSSIAIRKGDDAFLDYVDEFVRSWRASGGSERSFDRWLVPYGGNYVR